MTINSLCWSKKKLGLLYRTISTSFKEFSNAMFVLLNLVTLHDDINIDICVTVVLQVCIEKGAINDLFDIKVTKAQ